MRSALASERLEACFMERRLVVFTGSGGVGKTTVSAAAALALARRGKKVLAFTVDPARRLADALRAGPLGAEPRPIRLPDGFKGELWATQLDVQAIFESQLRSYAPSADVAERILKNPFTTAFTRAFAGIENYVAASRLHELFKARTYDVILVDTAASVHAIDFIDVPTRITDFLDANLIRWFLMPFKVLRSKAASVLREVTAPIFGKVEEMAGVDLIDDLASFLRGFEGLYQGLRDRAHELREYFEDARLTAFGLVTRPTHGTILQATQMVEALRSRGLRLDFLVINRIASALRPASDLGLSPQLLSAGVDALVAQGIVASVEEGNQLLSTMQQAYEVAWRHAGNEREALDSLEDLLPEVPVAEIPRFEHDISDLEGIVRMGGYMLGSEK